MILKEGGQESAGARGTPTTMVLWFIGTDTRFEIRAIVDCRARPTFAAFSEMFRWESSAYKSLVFWFGSVSLTLLEDNTIAS
jgi:hypothetical protein